MPKRTNTAIKEYQNKKGETFFMFKAYVGTDPRTGKKINTTRRGFGSYTEADRVFNKIKSEGLASLPSRDKTTFAQLYDFWWKSYEPTVKESTAHKAEEMFRVHIIPVFGNELINKITRIELQNYADKLATELVKYHHALGFIKRMFQYAISMGLMSENPVNNIIVPKKTSRPRRDTSINFYNRDQLETFLLAAKNYRNRAYVYFLLIASTGLRKSEAMAINWSDVDFKHQELRVDKTLALGYDNKLIVTTPKTKKSIRNVPISNNLLLELKKFKLQSDNNDIIFHSEKGGYLSLPKPAEWLQSIYNTMPADFKHITIHGFRHTYASLLFASNPSIKPTDVQAILGHETVKMTLDIYTHMTDEGEARVRTAIKELDIS